MKLSARVRRAERGLGTRGFLHAYRAWKDDGTTPADPFLADMVEDLSGAVASMASLDLDYVKPQEEEDWGAVIEEKAKLWPRNLTERWYPLFIHDVQHALWNDDHRFRIVPAGRRAGKSERGMRNLVRRALEFTDFPDGRFIAAGPTHDMAKDLFWENLKAFTPSRFVVGEPSEGALTLRLVNGARLMVRGVDRPQRIVGRPVDGILVDEYGDISHKLWETNLRPALSTIGRPGWAWLVGVPRGARHYKLLYERAREGNSENYSAFTWFSADILSAAEMKEVKATTDALTYAAEWEASFETTAERIYYNFTRKLHCEKLEYDPKLPLFFAFDFNTRPGVCSIIQEQPYKGSRSDVDRIFTAIIDEVHIPRNSKTPLVCAEVTRRYGKHPSGIRLYGDASGGAQTTVSVKGSDWDLIRECLLPFFAGRMTKKVRKANPRVVSRTGAVNSRFLTTDGKVHMLVDPVKCPHTVIDFEDVVPKEGTMEIDKDKNLDISHLCFAAGTLVDTCEGPVRIEDLPVSGTVRTWDGSVVPYEMGGWRGRKRIIRLHALGYSVDCTPDHRFLTTGGWVEAQDILGEECVTWQQVCGLLTRRPRCSKGFGIDVSRVDTLAGEVGGCTALSGSTFEARSREGGACTTSMAIHRTTGSRISAPCQLEITCGCTCRTRAEWSRHRDTSENPLSQRRRSGTVAEQADDGIVCTTRTRSADFTRRRTRSGVLCAARRSGPTEPTRSSSAPEPARRKIDGAAGWITRLAIANAVEQSMSATSTSRGSSVHINAPWRTPRRFVEIGDAGVADVFCITVPSTGCFALSGGLVVGNSDAIGYFCEREHSIARSGLTSQPL